MKPPEQPEAADTGAGDPFLEVGRFSGVFGTRGWLRVLSFTRPPANLLDYDPWYVRDGRDWRPLDVEAREVRGEVIIIRLAGVGDRESARLWVRRELAIRRSQLPPAAPGEHYWADLLGLAVVNRDGTRLGKVQRLLETGAHDVLVVRGEREHLIPFTRGVHVLRVDPVAGLLEVDWEDEEA